MKQKYISSLSYKRDRKILEEWSSMKTKDVYNLRPDGLKNLEKAVRKGYRRAKQNPDLLIGFLRASQLL